MTSKSESAIYAAFCEQFAQQYKQPNDSLRERVWNATKSHGLDKLSRKLLQRASEIETEQNQVMT